MNRLVLVDGNAILHRAYHAIPQLTAPDGSVVNAVYGFISMVFKLVGDLQPTHMVVAFDRPAPTFRKELLASYQAKRPEMDKELVGQIETVHEMIRAFDIPIFEQDGFEADDVIGTLATNAMHSVIPAHEPGSRIVKNEIPGQARNDKKIDQVIIVTGDRDLLQLVVDDEVFVYMPVKGLSEAKLYGEKEVVERLGVTPKQIPDYKALAGDASDNYPGVVGIGPKSAVHLVRTFGTVEALYEAVDTKKTNDVPQSLLQKLIAGRESAMLSKTLATVRRDVPVTVSWETVPKLDLNQESARKMLEKLHFHSLLKRLEHGLLLSEKPSRLSAKKTQWQKNEEQLSLI